MHRLLEHGPLTAVLSLLEPTEWELLLRARRGLRGCLDLMKSSLSELIPQWMWLHECTILGTAMATVNNLEDATSDREEPCLQAALVGLQLLRLDVNGADPVTGITALMVAAEEGHSKLSRLLLSQRADVNLVSTGGTTALEMCFGASGTCIKCRASSCRCSSRREVACSLLPLTACNLTRAWAGCVRLAVQQPCYCEVMADFAAVHGLCVNQSISSWYGRSESLLGIALGSSPNGSTTEAPHRGEVVRLLIAMKADPRSDQACIDWIAGRMARVEMALACDEDVQMLDMLWSVHHSSSALIQQASP